MKRAKAGQVVVIGAAAILVIGVFAVLTIDVGHAVYTRSVLQNAADAAALAAGHKLVEERNASEDEEDARESACDEALDFGAKNSDSARLDVAFGTYEGEEFVEQDDSVAASAVRVTATRDEDAPGGPLAMFFGPVIGMGSMELSATAIAKLTGGVQTIRGTGNLMPFAVWEGDVGLPGQIMIIYPSQLIVPGNFGLLNLDGGSCSASELAEWILDGYPGEVTIDPDLGYIWIDGSPGIKVSLKDEIETRIGMMVFVCVYDEVTGQGSNANFRIVQFLALTITQVKLTGGSKYVKARVERLVSIPNCETGGSSDSNVVKVHLAG